MSSEPIIKLQKNPDIVRQFADFSRWQVQLRDRYKEFHAALANVPGSSVGPGLGLEVGVLERDRFDLTYSGIRVRVRYTSELNDAADPSGRVSFYEVQAHGSNAEELLASIALSPDGMSNDISSDGDIGVSIASSALEITLSVFKKVLCRRFRPEGSN
ncbi:hypothetical protein WG922_09285 [Ramlibacter sp. AN1015]|uniref:hypothetical protein n=1 Tax=Ramlibacter sp. AN1015 TaxID=3133428 RepID=UPI0030C24099